MGVVLLSGPSDLLWWGTVESGVMGYGMVGWLTKLNYW